MEKLIDAETEKQLKSRFMSAMKGTVDVKVFTNPIIAPGDNQTQEIYNFAIQLVRELSAIDPRIIPQELTMSDPAARALGLTTSPSIAVGYDLGYRIIYNGAPLGYEATGFIETILTVSSNESGLSGAAKKAAGLIEKETKIQVFVTPTCPYCPKAVLTANRLAVERKGIIVAECVESAENQELAKKFNVSSVPMQVINGNPDSALTGALPDESVALQALKFGAPEKYDDFEKAISTEKAEKEKLIDNPSGVVYITDSNFKQALTKYEKLVVDCWAPWCGPCRMLSPIIEELASERPGGIVFGKLNTDENPVVAAENNISSIPTVLVFRNGALKGTIVGAQPKQELLMKINEMIG